MFPTARKIFESDLIDAMYIISPVGLRELTNYLEQKLGRFDIDSLNTTMKQLLAKGKIVSKVVDGVTLWGTPGTWI